MDAKIENLWYILRVVWFFSWNCCFRGCCCHSVTSLSFYVPSCHSMSPLVILHPPLVILNVVKDLVQRRTVRFAQDSSLHYVSFRMTRGGENDKVRRMTRRGE